jgi:hypothetical protein
MFRAFVISPTRATRSAHLTHLDLITLIKFREVYKLWNFLLRGFLHPPAPSFLVDPNILLSAVLPNTLKAFFP